jgi:hypothetical protein
MVSNEIIAGRLAKSGFAQVVVNGSGKSRQARGTWNGPDQIVDLPSQVSYIKLVGG